MRNDNIARSLRYYRNVNHKSIDDIIAFLREHEDVYKRQALAFSAAGTLFPVEGDVQFFANVITGLIVGVLAVKYMRPVIILTSAIVCGTSAAGLLPGVTEYMGITTLSSLNSSAALTLALCVLGIAVQFLTTKEPVKKTVPRHKHG